LVDYGAFCVSLLQQAIWSADAMDETTHAIFFKARINERVKTSDSASVDIKGKSF